MFVRLKHKIMLFCREFEIGLLAHFFGANLLELRGACANLYAFCNSKPVCVK